MQTVWLKRTLVPLLVVCFGLFLGLLSPSPLPPQLHTPSSPEVREAQQQQQQQEEQAHMAAGAPARVIIVGVSVCISDQRLCIA